MRVNAMPVLQLARSRRISAVSLLTGLFGLQRLKGQYIACLNVARLYGETLASKGNLHYSLAYATPVKVPAHSFVDSAVGALGSGEWTLELCDCRQTGATSSDAGRHTIYVAGARGQAGCVGGVLQQLGQVSNLDDNALRRRMVGGCAAKGRGTYLHVPD